MKLTKTKITTAIAFTCLLSGSAIAEQRSKQEKTNEVVGLSSGLIIGTAIAGPLGGIIAGVFGVMIADDVNTDKRLETAQHSLEKKDQELFVMQQNFQQAKERSMAQIASMDNALEQTTFKQTFQKLKVTFSLKRLHTFWRNTMSHNLI